MSCIIDQRKRTASHASIVENKVVHFANQTSSGIAALTISWTGYTSASIRVGGYGAVLKALIIVKQSKGSISGVETLLANHIACIIITNPTALYRRTNISNLCYCCSI